jgi:hypothetical protein
MTRNSFKDSALRIKDRSLLTVSLASIHRKPRSVKSFSTLALKFPKLEEIGLALAKRGNVHHNNPSGLGLVPIFLP